MQVEREEIALLEQEVARLQETGVKQQREIVALEKVVKVRLRACENLLRLRSTVYMYLLVCAFALSSIAAI